MAASSSSTSKRGLVQAEIGDERAAERDLEESVRLLPTTVAHFALGKLQLERGDERSAIEHFRASASTDSEIGKKAAILLARLEIEENPGKYIAAAADLDGSGYVVVTVRNQSTRAIEGAASASSPGAPSLARKASIRSA